MSVILKAQTKTSTTILDSAKLLKKQEPYTVSAFILQAVLSCITKTFPNAPAELQVLPNLKFF